MKSLITNSNNSNVVKTKELIALFRKYGGTFDNAELKYSNEYGYFLSTQNSNLDTTVSCPDNLLVDINDIDVNENGLFIINHEKYAGNMEFLEKYFEFHFNKKMLNYYIEQKRQIESLSNSELTLISNVFSANKCKAREIDDLEYTKKQMIISHNIGHFDKQVIMPFVTFINCHKDGAPYDIQKDSITISGRFKDQVFATYNNWDVMMFAEVGFISDTKNVYSYPITKIMPNGMRLTINRDPEESLYTDKGHRKPLITRDQGVITLSWFPLYREGMPLFPSRIANMIAADIGVSAKNYLQSIFKYNVDILKTTAIELNRSKNPYARYVATAAQQQLKLFASLR